MPHREFLPFRQIHLDFHTSEHIPDIAGEFNAEAFADTLVKAHVNSVTCFARCHHGWLYYDSQRFPERIHPQLQNKNLLKEQIEACHARGIRVPIYITVQWDYYTAERYPEWLQLEADGRIAGTGPYEAGFYRRLMVNSPYLDFLKAQTREVLETLPTDGIFFDIVKPLDDSSRWTKEAMLRENLDPTDATVRAQYGVEVISNFKREMTDFVKALSPDTAVFYNGGHIGPRDRTVKDYYDHFEVESLASTTYWGYLHFPLAVRYARTLGLDYLALTGKFHTGWGDFHSYKNRAALEYECYRMLAFGSKVMTGDQLHPDGTLDGPTYDLIGSVYAEVEKKEPWCSGVTAVNDIAVVSPEAFELELDLAIPKSLEGVSIMLDELAQQFDIVDAEQDLSVYKVVILPDAVPVDDALKRKLSAFVEHGGGLLASFASGMDAAQERFSLGALGVRLAEDDAPEARGVVFERNDYCEYLRPGELLGDGLVDTEYVMYIKGMPVRADAGTHVLVNGYASYFDRTYQHFCSHAQTPSSGKKATPAVVQNGKTIYFAHPIFTQYRENAPHWCKALVRSALKRLLPDPVVQHDSFSTLRVTLNDQAKDSRYVLHLLHYLPERRGIEFDTLEDVIPVYDVGLELNLPKKVKSVTLVPEGKALTFEQHERLRFRLPKLVGHQMVELNYEN